MFSNNPVRTKGVLFLLSVAIRIHLFTDFRPGPSDRPDSAPLTRCGASKPQSWYWSCTALGALCCYRNASPSRVPVGLPHGFSFPASTFTLGPPLRLLVGLQAGIDHPRRPRTIPTWRCTVTARRGVAVGYERRGVPAPPLPGRSVPQRGWHRWPR
jgi:hypothetical protein